MKPIGKSVVNGKSTDIIPPEMVSEIVATASDITIVLNSRREIHWVLVSPQHRSFGTLDHWVGKPVDDVLTIESRSKLDARLSSLRAGAGGSVSVELNHAESTIWELPVRYTLHRVAADDSILMLGRDLRPIAEMQQRLVNAQLALERDYEAQREMDTRYRALMEVTRDAIVLVSMSNGRIEDINGVAAKLLGGARSEFIGSSIAQEFEGRRRGELLESMASLAVADAVTPIELQSRRSQRHVMLFPTVFRAAGERLLLCRIDAAEAVPAVPEELAENLGRLFHDGVDAIAFIGADGLIRAANESFLNLTDAASQSTVQGRSMADFLVRGAVDLKVLLDNAKRAGRMRLYATKLATAFAGQVAVEISASYLNDRPNAVIALVIRDASRAETLRRPSLVGGEEGSRSLVELVGSSTLKDIVAETTDVVEKLCIETAVELTRNNRVAAAEMLGLSRQSLYVKLRKYGLIGKEVD